MRSRRRWLTEPILCSSDLSKCTKDFDLNAPLSSKTSKGMFHGMNILQMATLLGHWQIVEGLLWGVIPNTHVWASALHLAVAGNLLWIASFLLEGGAPVNEHGPFSTARYIVVHRRDVEMIRVLDSYGARDEPSVTNCVDRGDSDSFCAFLLICTEGAWPTYDDKITFDRLLSLTAFSGRLSSDAFKVPREVTMANVYENSLSPCLFKMIIPPSRVTLGIRNENPSYEKRHSERGFLGMVHEISFEEKKLSERMLLSKEETHGLSSKETCLLTELLMGREDTNITVAQQTRLLEEDAIFAVFSGREYTRRFTIVGNKLLLLLSPSSDKTSNISNANVKLLY